jgi:uncharacterized membrane protein
VLQSASAIAAELIWHRVSSDNNALNLVASSVSFTMSVTPAGSEESNEIAGVLDRNILAIIQNRKEQEKNVTWQDRTAQTITGFIGTIRFVFLHLFFFGGWILLNSGLITGTRFDPTFGTLSICISMEAIFLSTFVLISQNRMLKLDARRSELSLQVNLLAEHEITHLLHLVKAIADKMHLENAKNPELNELQREVKPEQILQEIERRENRVNEAETEKPTE